MLIINSRYLNKYIYLIYNNCTDVRLYLKKKRKLYRKIMFKKTLEYMMNQYFDRKCRLILLTMLIWLWWHSYDFRNSISWNFIFDKNTCFLFQRAELSDFDRFKLRKARQIRNKLRTDAFYRLKKKTKKVKAGDVTSKSAKKAEK